MSMTEQKFDSLCALAEKLKTTHKIDVCFWLGEMSITISTIDGNVLNTGGATPDQALTKALRCLRKIKTKQ